MNTIKQCGLMGLACALLCVSMASMEAHEKVKTAVPEKQESFLWRHKGKIALATYLVLYNVAKPYAGKNVAAKILVENSDRAALWVLGKVPGPWNIIQDNFKALADRSELDMTSAGRIIGKLAASRGSDYRGGSNA